MFCPRCGSAIEPGDTFCPQCGADVRDVSHAAPPPPPPGTFAEPVAPPLPGAPAAPPPLPSQASPRMSSGAILGVIIAAFLGLAVLSVGGFFAIRAMNSHSAPLVSENPPVTQETPPSSTTATSAGPATEDSATTDSIEQTAPVATTSPTIDTKLHTPAPGSSERKAILDVLRVPVRKDLGQPVIFKVNAMAVQDNWAFVFAQPLRTSGKPIDYRRTRHARDVRAGMFGDDCSGLLRYQDGTWTLVTWNIGATDVVWTDWDKTYGAPSAIFKIN